ncbi:MULTISPECIES: TIGR03768 family metallophosphoesterase [unclassified Polynucleobacter]|jgi:metallophosphoesterase (TIGR03768 family)|uniref:TIGR03768 family metallophosphoesterase n=1 Tax=unclassified Polynucleobacter TaxID=2640945 RepID=UPI000BD2DAF9|nr:MULTISPECIES: TIGR03768 family metallophosphoesterase [unclassified Polynucleobacter]OYY17603.1 MAG: metallophosphoesterase [Polynucleobacter sp. 35-46-11]OZA76949.1 MAG: metallophosphoesterase [Polynucleobacter sp. 39-46-10]
MNKLDDVVDKTAMNFAASRRMFMKYSVGSICLSYSGIIFSASSPRRATYPISDEVKTTVDRMLSFSMPEILKQPGSGKGLAPTELHRVDQYSKFGYGNYTYGPGLPIQQRFDLMDVEYTGKNINRVNRLSSFFTISDIHLTDKQAGNQLIALQQLDSEFGAPMTSIYSPTMLTTTHVLDAVVQTVNALHVTSGFDFGLSLGDTCNSTQYNETRWYLDILDGKVIYPNTSNDVSQDTISYQQPFQAAGLSPDIPWFQVNGNHDLFMIGSVAVDADPSLKLRESYINNRIWAVGNMLQPIKGSPYFPCLFDTTSNLKSPDFYMGTINGASEYGEIIGAGPVNTFGKPPLNSANLNRRSLTKKEWIREFFNTSSLPKGHGYHLVDPLYANEEPGFSCYSFLPKEDIPLRIIVLDNVQDPKDQSHDIHGHGYLSATRVKWLRAELMRSQKRNELVIIASHVPLAVAPIGSEMEWWESSRDPNAKLHNAITLTDLISEIQANGNVICLLAGHRHVNAIKAFKSPPGAPPEYGFWQIETSSLHDFPQQFRTLQVYLNSDYTISIVAINIDPAVREGSPAESGRRMSIAAQQIIQNDIRPNAPNVERAFGVIPVSSMDPTRPQNNTTDDSIRYGEVVGVPYSASYNAELFKSLNPTMVEALKKRFPA